MCRRSKNVVNVEVYEVLRKGKFLLALMRRDSYLVLPNPRVKASRWTDDGKLTLLKYRSDAKRIYRQLSERERKVEKEGC